MAQITKIEKHPLGEFTVSFSIKSGLFEIKYPAGIDNDKIWFPSFKLKTWDDVQLALKQIVENYLHETLLTRKVIIIQLKTSESNIQVEKPLLMGKGTRMETSEDFLQDAQGFQIMWYVAEEYLYPGNSKKYKIIEKNKNNNSTRYDRVEILGQLLFSSYGEPRVFDYSEHLHEYLKSLDQSISDLVKKLEAHFDRNPENFLANIQNGQRLIG